MPDAASHLVAHGATRCRIHWIPNGVNFNLVPPVVPPKPKEALELIYAGAYGGGNNPELILDAAVKLRERGGPLLRFRFIGNGAGEHALLAKRAALNLDNVSFEPPVPRAQVYSLLNEADILLAPYAKLDVHRFGVSLNKLFDYMAVARPIIFATCASNHPVTDARCGIEVPADDADALANSISTLAGLAREERWQLGLNGRRYAEQNHNFARLAVKLETIRKPSLPVLRASLQGRIGLPTTRVWKRQGRFWKTTRRCSYSQHGGERRPLGTYMDLTGKNLETISSIRLHNMTVAELAEVDRRAGMRLHFSDGVW
jgi:glycosyltransferase involved in cell wall biosynthesis